MTIEYPRAFPDGVHVATTQFECREIVRTSPLGNGGRESIHQWPARWRGAWRTQWLAGEKLGAMQAWLSSLRNGGKSFLGRETGRAPQAGHVSGLGGSPAVSAVTDLDEIAVEGLPAGAALKAGDLFSVSQIVSAIHWQALCRVDEDVIADGSGDIAALKFSPPLPAGIFTTDAALEFFAPTALMKLTPGSVAEEQFGAQLRYAFAGEQIWGVAIPPVTGAMAARESGPDVFTGSGSAVVSGSMAAQEGGADSFAGAGAVFVSGSMLAREAGADVLTGSGSVAVSGSMAARESGSDSFIGMGIVGNPVIGSMAAQESGPDSFMGVGSVLVSGSLAARESGGDSFSGEGGVTVSGSMAAQESGADVFTGSGAVTAFSPAILTLAAWWDFSDAGTLFQDSSTTTPVMATSDPIGYVGDKSGNGRHLFQSTGGLKPAWNDAGYADFDDANDVVASAFSTAGMTDMSVWIALQITDATTFIGFHNGAGPDYFVAVGENGSGASPHISAGSPAYYVDGSVITSDRDSIYDSLIGATRILEVRGVDLSSWGGARLGHWATTWALGGNVYQALVMTTAEADANRANIAAWLAAKMGS